MSDVNQRPDVTGLQPIDTYCFDDRVGHLFLIVRDRHQGDVGRFKQPVHVVLEPEDRRPVPTLIAADPLERGQAIVERMRQHMDRGILPIDERAVHPDLLARFQHHTLRRAHRDGRIMVEILQTPQL